MGILIRDSCVPISVGGEKDIMTTIVPGIHLVRKSLSQRLSSQASQQVAIPSHGTALIHTMPRE